ncbi:hypothetical protein BH24ACT9_BH24ACT9_12660 [soil metagenome]
MLTVEIALLTGRYVATRYNNRDRVEWPPHPARLFSAAVSTWADADLPDPQEREALHWWEQQGAPEITCSWESEATDGSRIRDWAERSPSIHFVPVNDPQAVNQTTTATYEKLVALKQTDQGSSGDAEAPTAIRSQRVKLAAKAAADSRRLAEQAGAALSAMEVLPDLRAKQARRYPTAVPADDLVTMCWPEADRQAPQVVFLDRLLGRIARLGHSSSLVSVRIIDAHAAPTLVPDERGQLDIRIAVPGQLRALERAYLRHQANEPRVLPARNLSYGAARSSDPDVRAPTFGEDWIVLEPGRRFMIGDSMTLCRTVRAALMAWSPEQPAPEIISGHVPGPAGESSPPTSRNHLAILALPFADHPHADGSIHGMALAIPRSATEYERTAVFTAAGSWLEQGNGELRAGRRVSTVEKVDVADAGYSVRPGRWSRPSRLWRTVTPIALDRHPGDISHRDPRRRDAAVQRACDSIILACNRIGLPSPASVKIDGAPFVTGTRPVGAFPPYEVQQGRVRRQLVHAEIGFAEAVRGPVVLGAGRFVGLGLCAPIAPDPGGERSRG